MDADGEAMDDARSTHALTRDGALVLRAPASMDAVVRHWLPAWPREGNAGAADGPPPARIELRRRAAGEAMPVTAPSAPSFTLGGATAHVVSADEQWFAGASRQSWGRVDLSERTAELTGDPLVDDGLELYSMLTGSSALLLGRLGRALVHAAAVVDPGGNAWLIAGDAGAGKTSTCATLVEGGWRYLSDDHVVIAPGARGGIDVEGWPRPFHLDAGWDEGVPRGGRADRTPVDSAERWPNAWQRSAPLAGVFYSRVTGTRTTTAAVTAADSFTRLLRQSPWLLADRTMAPSLMALFERVARHTAIELCLARDSFRRADVLLSVLRGRTSGRS